MQTLILALVACLSLFATKASAGENRAVWLDFEIRQECRYKKEIRSCVQVIKATCYGRFDSVFDKLASCRETNAPEYPLLPPDDMRLTMGKVIADFYKKNNRNCWGDRYFCKWTNVPLRRR